MHTGAISYAIYCLTESESYMLCLHITFTPGKLKIDSVLFNMRSYYNCGWLKYFWI